MSLQIPSKHPLLCQEGRERGDDHTMNGTNVTDVGLDKPKTAFTAQVNRVHDV